MHNLLIDGAKNGLPVGQLHLDPHPVAAPPAQGQVSFEPNQSTTVMQSSTGRCTGGRMPGTGVYYTARPGAQGTDTFTITATAESGVATSRTFTVRIAE